MPQNMQGRPKVVQLAIDENEAELAALEADTIEEIEEDEPEKLLSDAEYHAIALKHLQRGLKEKDIASRLVGEGMPRLDAEQLVKKVKAENPDIERTNSYILLGAGTLLTIPGVLWLLWNFLAAGTIFTPAAILIFAGGWFLYKGFVAYRKLQ